MRLRLKDLTGKQHTLTLNEQQQTLQQLMDVIEQTTGQAKGSFQRKSVLLAME